MTFDLSDSPLDLADISFDAIRSTIDLLSLTLLMLISVL